MGGSICDVYRPRIKIERYIENDGGEASDFESCIYFERTCLSKEHIGRAIQYVQAVHTQTMCMLWPPLLVIFSGYEKRTKPPKGFLN